MIDNGILGGEEVIPYSQDQQEKLLAKSKLYMHKASPNITLGYTKQIIAYDAHYLQPE